MGHAPRSTLIIGAGIGGLTAALALLRAGWHVRVFEQAATLGEAGAGITISPGAGRGLASLGLGPALLAASMPVPSIAFAHYRTGELLAGVSDASAPPDHGLSTPRHIHRADLHALLLGAVRERDPQAVASGKRLRALEQHPDRVTATFEDGSTAQAAILLGADGARSVARRHVIDDTQPAFAGQVAFRCLIPSAQAAPFMGHGRAVVWIGPGRILNRYAIRQATLVNVIGIARTSVWYGEGWNAPATVAEFAAQFEGFHPDVLGLIGCAAPHTLIRWGLFARPAIARWHAGRVLLLGDAAHPILPFLGLGAALAIEDAIVLARVLESTGTTSTGTIAQAFAAFQAARTGRVELVRSQTIRQGEIIQGGDPASFQQSRPPSQETDLFDYDPCTAAIRPATAFTPPYPA